MTLEKLRAMFEDDDPCDLSIDEALHLFSNERRRYVVELIDILGPMDIGALADAIAMVSDDERKAVYVALWQSHLSKLDDADVIDRGEQGHHVEPGDHFSACAEFVADAQDRFKDTNGDRAAEFEYQELVELAEGESA